MLKDPSGRLIKASIKIDEIRAEQNDFVPMPPGAKIEAEIDIYKTFAFQDRYFRQDGVYKLTAIYQNNMQVEENIDGETVTSWIGEVSSNEVSFQIASRNCK